tara:strand:+ start:1431 stop:1583 length:153 start_codon:yes stop_codon:yes gene_type:complete
MILILAKKKPVIDTGKKWRWTPMRVNTTRNKIASLLAGRANNGISIEFCY